MKPMPRGVVRDAVLTILRKSSEPATTRELVTAAYYFTGDDRVGYATVAYVLRTLAAERQVLHLDGKWQAVAR